MAKSETDQPLPLISDGAIVLMTMPMSDMPVPSPMVAASSGRQLVRSSDR